jgi:hypothetical protein
MATLEQILDGMIAFRDEVYSRLTLMDDKLDSIANKADAAVTGAQAAVVAGRVDKFMYELCHHCGGDGIKGPDEGVPCPDCNATGWVRIIGKIGPPIE